VLASDGLWDCFGAGAAVGLVRRLLLESGGDVAWAARGAVERALEAGSVDNITVCVVLLQ
jgi:serine/threonine protein phosphatase PrpC